MPKIRIQIALSVLILCSCAQGVFAQSGNSGTPANPHVIQRSNIKMNFPKINKLSPNMKSALQKDGDGYGNNGGFAGGFRTIPHWHGSFTYQGTVYPYIMAGQNPKFSNLTFISTRVIPINLVLDGCLDTMGNPTTFQLDPATLKNIFNSPEFDPVSFASGFTQYTDAFQRAEFFKVMRPDWHTLLAPPRILEPVTIEVPPEDSTCLTIPPNGQPFGDVDFDYFAGQMATILQLENVDPSQLPIALTKDVVLYTGGNTLNCCIFGFHGAGGVLDVVGNPMQTFTWASWLSAADNFGNGVEDILPLSHEIGEWANDPFANNMVPPWQVPNGSGECGGNLLEVGDPIEGLTNPSFPIVSDGYLYHEQTLALLQWFTRETPSSALDGAYSFANQSLLTSPSVACTP